MNFKKLLPYLYFAGAIFFLVSAINRYSQDLEQYRIIFSFYTEDKDMYIIARVLIVILITVAGVVSLRKSRQS